MPNKPSQGIMGVEEYLNCSYKLVSSDNLAAYLEAMGVAPQVKEAILAANTTVTLTESGGVYTIHTSSSVRDHDITFTPGVEFEDVGIDGRTYNSVINIDGNKIIHEVLGDPKCTITSEYTDEKLIVTFVTGAIEATQILERV